MCTELRTMGLTFQLRFQEAASYAGIEFSPTAIGRSLGVSKQTAQYWMTTGEPKAAMVFRIADTWTVDARWLATGQGTMLPPPGGQGLSADEVEMIRRYRKAEPRSRASILAVAKTLKKATAMLALVAIGWAAPFDKTQIAYASVRPESGLITHWHAFVAWLRQALFRVPYESAQTSDAAIA